MSPFFHRLGTIYGKSIVDMQIDIPLSAFCWTLAYAACLDIPVLPWESVVGSASLSWLMCLLNSRKEANRPGSLVALIPVIILVYLAKQGISSYILPFFLPALICNGLTQFFRNPTLRLLGSSSAVAMACAAPAVGYSFEMAPFTAVCYLPVWMLTLLLWLHRSTLLRFPDSEPCKNRHYRILYVPAMGALLLIAAYQGDTAEYTFALAALSTPLLSQLFFYTAKRFSPASRFLTNNTLTTVLPALAVYFILGCTRII